MKWFFDRDYAENFIRYHKKTIIKVIAGFMLFVIAFFVFCIRDHKGGESFELIGQEKDNLMIAVQQEEKEKALQEEEGQETESKIHKKIYVDVSGAVNKPYVYEMDEGARVYQALDMAGGLTAEANTENLNLAQILKDQDKIVVLTTKELMEVKKSEPVLQETASGAVQNGVISGNGQSELSNSEGLININTADASRLQSIKGIGPSTAEKIVDFRNENGNFKKIEELMKVSGIGEKTFLKFKDKIVV